MTNTAAKSLRKHLGRIKLATASIIRDANYDTSAVGRMRNSYQKDRGWQKHVRAAGKLKRLLGTAERLTTPMGADIGETMRAISAATMKVLEHCDYFPGNREWPGQPAHSRQLALIESLRSSLQDSGA